MPEADDLTPTQTCERAASSPRLLPRAGELFGSYHIVRKLGEGGMGTVFEAEEKESGRRIALKVLSQALDAPEARQRFLREGRLAASINHPNSVYVYGTEEISGTPVIVMELVAGGTLQQRVVKDGPMPVGRAVDALLQVTAGLDAAQALGILHRDVKPSNCFEDLDGLVKIGDFGLSISSVRLDSAVTTQGAFLGTPSYASPEQLRGDELDVRSDIYAAGATLFYLLTGRTPFEGRNPVQLMAQVLEQPAPSPRTFQPSIPHDLERVVLRCLEKQPAQRYKNYQELRQALAPFSSEAPTAAPLGLRFLAGALDLLLLGAVVMAISVLWLGEYQPFPGAVLAPGPGLWAMMFAGSALVLLYYAVLEGVWGASLGKAICRLRVGARTETAGPWRALLRAVICQLASLGRLTGSRST